MGQVSSEVLFRTLDDATAADLAYHRRELDAHVSATLSDRVIGLLGQIAAPPVLSKHIGGLQHSLQTATRAERDGAGLDLVVAALLHDIGDVFAPANHAEFGAAVVKPYLNDEATWVVRHHAIFQGYHYWHKVGLDRNVRDRFKGHPYYEVTAHFCAAWDQRALDPDYDTLPLQHFEPMVREVFARPAARFGADASS